MLDLTNFGIAYPYRLSGLKDSLRTLRVMFSAGKFFQVSRKLLFVEGNADILSRKATLARTWFATLLQWEQHFSRPRAPGKGENFSAK